MKNMKKEKKKGRKAKIKVRKNEKKNQYIKILFCSIFTFGVFLCFKISPKCVT